MKSRIAIAAFLAAGLLGATAYAGNRDRDIIGDLIDAGITAALARQYAHSAGFDGYSSLPPGIRKNLMRGKPLPPGIAKKVRSGAFLERLPRYSGYEWQTAGTDLILVSIATGVIADILYDVFDWSSAGAVQGMNSRLMVTVGGPHITEFEEHFARWLPVALLTSTAATRVISETMANTGQNGHLFIFMVGPFIVGFIWHHAGFLHCFGA
jgi:hypothetical protein